MSRWPFLLPPLQVLSTICGLLGISGLLTFYLTRSWQRKQWLRDNKMAEYRELLSALSKSAHYILHTAPHYVFADMTMQTGDEGRQSAEADIEARRVIADRILIADRIRSENILERWQGIMPEKDGNKFWIAWLDLHKALVRIACEDLDS
jgi:hypothetical protein